ncbi:MAG: hypothetical protein IRY85_12420 [Micromonosporaceae bacterium]|nr:hypothetical protein [Micromonosporaceae bacterium]
MTRPRTPGPAGRAWSARARMSPVWTALWRGLRHEWTLAALAAVALALVLNRGALAEPTRTLPRDIWDPSLVAYLIAWTGHALRHDPAGLWHLNAFYPAPYGLAYSDSLLGYAPFGLIGTGPEAAVLRYNLIYVGAYALVLFGGYCLARQLGLRPGPAALVGVALVAAPWRLAQAGHLQVLSTGGIFLSLAMLARGHGVRWLQPPGQGQPEPGTPRQAPPVRPGWALAGWLVATWQLSLGFGIGLPFLYVLLGCLLGGVVVWAIRHRDELAAGRPMSHRWRSALPPRALLAADLGGGLVFAGVALLLAQPYLRVLELYPYARRGPAWVELYSPPLTGLFLAPAESTIWGQAQSAAREALTVPGEMALLPGFVLYALAATGLVYSVWPRHVRIGLAVGVVGFAVLCLGTNGPAGGRFGYLALLHLPGFEAIRTPGRLILWVTLLLALLGAGALGSLRTTPLVRPATAARGTAAHAIAVHAAVVLAVAAVLVEGRGAIPNVPVPPAPPTLSTVEAPYLVLPTHEVVDMNVMLWSTDRFAPVVNGGSGLVPAELRQVREVVATFPDPASVAHLRAIGVRSVVVLRSRAVGTPYANADVVPINGLPLTRQVYPDAVVFTIQP